MSRICAGAGIPAQRRLLGSAATRDRVRAAITGAAAAIDPHGLLVLTFAGHSERGEAGVQWCLYDGGLPLHEVADMLTGVPASARIVVVNDTCYAAALATLVQPSLALVLLAACGADQLTLARPTSDFVVRLEQLVYPAGIRNPSCTTYTWLDQELRRDTPDAERPGVWTHHTDAWRHRPFALSRSGSTCDPED